MKELKFKCKLLSDVILNRKSATSGPNETLDFIPGNNFLGIAASRLYPKYMAEETDSSPLPGKALIMFHSGKVRFGDAHPSQGNFRGLKIPASMFYPKLGSPEKELYIHHRIPSVKDMRGKQLKQCRNGFYDFSDSDKVRLLRTATNFALKSAYDRENRRSKDEHLFGYQSLRSGLNLLFSVEIDDSEMTERQAEELIKDIRDSLQGVKKVGRSRSAQYGLVEITETDYDEIQSGVVNDNYVAVYADSRLIFPDEYGIPSFRPSARQLGLEGEVDWEKSQIRTFRYAPWNFKRQSFDTDRCGIEKGSVIVVKLNGAESNRGLTSQYVGIYNNEGFGKVIYNPRFLDADSEGISICHLRNDSQAPAELTAETSPIADSHANSSPLLEYLRKQKESQTSEVYGRVNSWVKENGHLFKDETFASQWGNIRNLALSAPDIHSLRLNLFDTSTGYLTHGVASQKWEDKGRLNLLRRFVDSLEPSNALQIMINLASEMAKISKD